MNFSGCAFLVRIPYSIHIIIVLFTPGAALTSSVYSECGIFYEKVINADVWTKFVYLVLCILVGIRVCVCVLSCGMKKIDIHITPEPCVCVCSAHRSVLWIVITHQDMAECALSAHVWRHRKTHTHMQHAHIHLSQMGRAEFVYRVLHTRTRTIIIPRWWWITGARLYASPRTHMQINHMWLTLIKCFVANVCTLTHTHTHARRACGSTEHTHDMGAYCFRVRAVHSNAPMRSVCGLIMRLVCVWYGWQWTYTHTHD